MSEALTASTVPPHAPPEPRRDLPELLAPAGDWECARAAVENGADAIYFGLEKFNARMRADNFTEADLPKLMDFLHRRGVRGYVTLNTLVFQNELGEAEQYLRTMITAGVDAVIVQDVGICRLIRQLSPDFPIHASTQMTVTSSAGMEFARELGCQLVVLARECSLKEIQKIHQAPGGSPLPIEVFVHGALCVAYSGQCLTSESLGGRSANRGECAQACRMPYELIADGVLLPLGDRRYLLSPQDLSGIHILPELIRTGVASLKIEGRLKSPEYVANITRAYRQALDELQVDPPPNPESALHHPQSRAGTRQYELEMAFSRGLHTGWFRGINNQQLVHARFGKKRGVYLGEVTRVLRDSVLLQLRAPLKRGDGVVFDAGNPEEPEEGGRIYDIRIVNSNSSTVELRFGSADVNFTRIHPGNKLWKTSDPELDRQLRQTFEGDRPRFQRPISMEIRGTVGIPLTVVARDEAGTQVTIASAMPLASAERQPLTAERLRDQLGRLGGTPFRLETLLNRLEGAVLLPISELNRIRRAVVSQLEASRTEPRRWTLRERRPDDNSRGNSDERKPEPRPAADLIVLVRTLPQLETALKCGTRILYCDFEDPKKYRDAVSRFRAAHDCQSLAGDPQPAIFVAPPRIFKPGEEWILEQVRSSGPDGFLVRNFDHLKCFDDCRKVGDYSLNVANRIAADYFKNTFGLERITASYDLNFQQLESLLKAAPPEWFEITIHQHMPMFHMEHCVFCAFLSNGTDFRNCGRPCDTHDLKLKDRVGAEHPVKADVGCRNTVFNSRAQTGAEYVERMLALGVRQFRIEFLNESPEEVAQVLRRYRQLLRGEISGTQLWRELKLSNQLGVTRGQIGAA